jgi:hypothetical protein
VPAYDGGFDAATVARAEQLLAQHIVARAVISRRCRFWVRGVP